MQDENNQNSADNNRYRQEDGETDRDKRRNRSFIIALILLIIFVLILILFLYLIRRPALFGSFARGDVSTSTSTSTSSNIVAPSVGVGSVSYDNSYLFASPLRAVAGSEKIRITAYVLDDQGMGVAEKKVVLGNNQSTIRIEAISDITDSSGRATFDVSSDQAGLFAIEASIDGKKLNQAVSVTFN